MEHLLFVGLGNPGERYELTRHNLGIRTLSLWVAGLEGGASVTDWSDNERFQAKVCGVRNGDVAIDCLFPLTYMNESGKSVSAYLKYHQLPTSNILVVHDDMELPLGEVKLQWSGSAKGHNGVRSVHAELATTDVARLRMGVGRPADGRLPEDFVLSRFSAEEEALVLEMVKKATVVLDDTLKSGQVDFST